MLKPKGARTFEIVNQCNAPSCIFGYLQFTRFEFISLEELLNEQA